MISVNSKDPKESQPALPHAKRMEMTARKKI